jgi:hypothetical protein
MIDTSKENFNIKKAFKTEKSRFHLYTSLKLVGVYFFCVGIFYFLLKSILDINLSFFTANGFPDGKQLIDSYYEFILKDIWEHVLYISGFAVALFFIGNYISDLLLRPFNAISQYCEKYLENGKSEFIPDQFSDLKTLTLFSEHFFHYMEMSDKENRFLDAIVPEHYTKIRRPVWEKVFFLHFMIMCGGICLATIFFLSILCLGVHENMVELAVRHLRDDPSVKTFLSAQSDMLTRLLRGAAVTSLTLFFGLGLHLYSGISTAAFGFFATFRAYMRGNHTSRIHLIGHNFLRIQGRTVNKYLDQMVKKLDNKKKE